MDVDAYLARIGAAAAAGEEVETLFELQRRHLLAVPFDALDCLLGNPVELATEAAYRKVVERRRGGFCFELNGLFAGLLTELGFEVSYLAARPLRGEDWVAPPFAHMALLVERERRWLVDVGFGYPFAIEPLDLDERAVQERGGRRFRIAATDEGLLVEEPDAPERRAYLLDPEPVPRQAFAARCHEYSTDPESMFVRLGPVLQQHEDGWALVTRERVEGVRGGVELGGSLESEAAWREALAEHFGLIVAGREVNGRGSAPPSRD